MMIFDLHFTTIYNALLFLIQSKQSCASNEYSIANLEEDIKEIIDEAEAFDKSIDDLEYTVIHLENSFAHLQNVGKDPFGFFSANKPDDLITVIEVTNESRYIEDHMPGISKCLQAYISEDNKKEHFTEGIAMRVDTIKSKDLYRYELLYGSTYLFKQFRDFLQTTFIKLMNPEIEHGLYRCMTDYLRNKASEYVADKSFTPLTIEDYRLLKLKAREDNNIECFFNDAFVHINSVILGDIIVDNQKCMISKIASKIQKRQLKDKIQYFDSNNLIEEVRKVYSDEFQNLMRCNFAIAKEKMLEAFKEMPVARFKIICGDYVLSAIEKQKSNRSSSVNDSLSASSKPTLSKEVLNHSDSEQGYDMKIIDYFEDALVEFRTKVDTHTLFGLKSADYIKNLKIVCSEKITKENIHLLCHILNNIKVKAFKIAKQVLYINLRENVDLKTVSSQILKLVECCVSESATHGSMHINHKLKNINIISKKQGERSLSLATIDKSLLLKSLSLKDPTHESALTSKICDIVERDTRVIDLMRNKRLLITRYLSTPNKNGITIQYENSNQYNLVVVKIHIQDVSATESLKLELFRTVKHINAANNPQNTSNLQNDFRLINARTLNKRYVYPRLLQFLSMIVCLPEKLNETPYFEIFDCGFRPNHEYLLHDKIVCQKVPTEQVFDKINAIKENIERMHESNLDTFKIHMIETNLSDFLRREHSLSWAKATKEFLKNNSMELATFGKIVYKHLVGMYLKDASKDFVIPSIVSQDQKILIIAVVRKNTNTILYIVRKDLVPVLGNLPMSSLMDFFMDDSNDIYNCDDESFEDLFILNCVDVNAIVCVVTTMAALKFNMTGDFVTQFKRKKDAFITHLYSLIGPHFSFYDLPFDKAFSSGGNQNTKKVTLMRLTYKSIFEREILIILARMEQKMKKIKFDPSIRVTILSTNHPNTNDLKDVDNTIQYLR